MRKALRYAKSCLLPELVIKPPETDYCKSGRENENKFKGENTISKPEMTAHTFHKWEERAKVLGCKFLTLYEECDKTGNVKIQCEQGHISSFIFRSLTAKIAKVGKGEIADLCVSCSKTGRRPEEEQVKDRCREFGFTLVSYDKPGRKGVYQCICGHQEPFANRQLLSQTFRPGCMKCAPLLRGAQQEVKTFLPEIVRSLVSPPTPETLEQKSTFERLSASQNLIERDKAKIPGIIYLNKQGQRAEYKPTFLIDGSRVIEPIRDIEYDRQADTLYNIIVSSRHIFELWVYRRDELFEVVSFDPNSQQFTYKYGNRIIPKVSIGVSAGIYLAISRLSSSSQGLTELQSLLRGIPL